jgi:hypothetical protein
VSESTYAQVTDTRHRRTVEGHGPAEGDATLTRRGEGNLRAVGDHRALVLGGGSEDLEREATGGGRGVESGVNGGEAVAALHRLFEHRSEVAQASSEAVHLRGYHEVTLTPTGAL